MVSDAINLVEYGCRLVLTDRKIRREICSIELYRRRAKTCRIGTRTVFYSEKFNVRHIPEVKVVYLPSPCSLEATWHPRLQPGTVEPLGCCGGCVLAPISVLRVEIPHPLRDKKLKQTTSHKTRAVLPPALPSVFSYVLRCLLKPVCVCIHACPPVVVVILWCWLSLSLSLSHAHFFQFCFYLWRL